MHRSYWDDLSQRAYKTKLILEENVPKYSHMLLVAIDSIVDELLRKKIISGEDDILRCIERTITNRNPRQSIIFDKEVLKSMDIETEEEIENALLQTIDYINEILTIPLNQR